MPDDLTKAFSYRLRAEELRRIAEGYKSAGARKLLTDAADSYEHMADRIDPPKSQ